MLNGQTSTEAGMATMEPPVGPLAEVETIPWYKVPLPLWAQLTRFLITFLISVLLLAACLLVTNARMPDPKKVTWLPDLMLEILPKIPWFEAFTNICIAVLNITIAFCVLKMFVLHWHATRTTELKLPFSIPKIGPLINRILFRVVDSGRRPYPVNDAYLIAAIRFLTVYLVMMLYRSVVITFTSYPATDNHCQNPQVIEHPILNMVLTLVTLGSGAIHCGDLMFSGHTIILCLAFCLSWEYGAFLFRKLVLFRLFLVLVLSFAFLTILIARSHYTDDIVVAAYSTVTTYMLLRHDVDGAPWQLQLLIRWWPCPFASENPEWEAAHAAAAKGNEGVRSAGPAVEVLVEAAEELVEEPRDRSASASAREMSKWATSASNASATAPRGRSSSSDAARKAPVRSAPLAPDE